MTQKKMLLIGNPLSSDPLVASIEEGDEEKTVSQLLFELAENIERSNAIEARQLMNLARTHNFYINGIRIPKETKISDLNFELQVTNSGDNVLTCDLQLQDQHSGGCHF